ncbi:MAG: heavy-metal-associated domain-containing protein [Desulfobacteraceae bacterium]|nr:heavy-metal-associated domain-containing protein [Desulfobacteraceae bacterium]
MASQKITINVDGMNCGHCSGMVEKTLEAIKGISEISVSLENKNATFLTDDNANIQKAINGINTAGYKAFQ